MLAAGRALPGRSCGLKMKRPADWKSRARLRRGLDGLCSAFAAVARRIKSAPHRAKKVWTIEAAVSTDSGKRQCRVARDHRGAAAFARGGARRRRQSEVEPRA